MTVEQIVNHDNQNSLSNEQKRQTSLLIKKHERLFDGKCGNSKRDNSWIQIKRICKAVLCQAVRDTSEPPRNNEKDNITYM